MYSIRPLSDLQHNLSEIETAANNGEPVFLTKNGYGALVVPSLEKYAELTDITELMLDEADRMAAMTDKRYTLEETYTAVRALLNEC